MAMNDLTGSAHQTDKEMIQCGTGGVTRRESGQTIAMFHRTQMILHPQPAAALRTTV